MKNEYWSNENKNKIYVSSKLPPNSAVGYVKPELKKVATKIKADNNEFIPTYSSKNEADLFINLPSETLLMTTGSSEVIDCGFELEIPNGYKLCVSSQICGLFLNLIDSKRIKVNASNFGKKLILKHKQVIGKIWIEPVYFFDWITKG
jgi:hypothetical protein